MSNYKHGGTKNSHGTRWRNMMDRCYDEKCKSYKNYGGRGVKVCSRWLSINNYVKDIESGYFQGAELDRIDNDGNYSPDNTRWVTKKENCNNRRTCVMISFNGVTASITDHSEKLGINPKMVMERISAGWDVERALVEPMADRHENILKAQGKRWEGHVKIPKKENKTSRKIKTVEYNGKTYTMKQLSELTGITRKTLHRRLFELKWPIGKAVINKDFSGNNQFTEE